MADMTRGELNDLLAGFAAQNPKYKEALLNDPDLQGDELVVRGERRNEAVAIVEAPRGTLFHHYRVDAVDRVVMANLIVSTTSNNEPMNRAVRTVA